jgi:hypothetical protein
MPRGLHQCMFSIINVDQAHINWARQFTITFTEEIA